MENTKDMKYRIDKVGDDLNAYIDVPELNLQPNDIRFYNSKGECVGTLHLDDDPIWFEGNVDESAKILLDEVMKEYMNWRNLYENR